jgi:hypothetical protein
LPLVRVICAEQSCADCAVHRRPSEGGTDRRAGSRQGFLARGLSGEFRVPAAPNGTATEGNGPPTDGRRMHVGTHALVASVWRPNRIAVSIASHGHPLAFAHSVRRVFPRYGCKAGLSDGAFPTAASLKSAPDMRVATTGLHPSFVHFVVTSVVADREPRLGRVEDAGDSAARAAVRAASKRGVFRMRTLLGHSRSSKASIH